MMNRRLLLRRDTAARWAAANPVLLAGEPGVESDTRRVRFGDGSRPFLELPWVSLEGVSVVDVAGLEAALAGKANTSHGHAITDVTNLQSALDGKAAVTHGHAISDVTNLQDELNSKSSTTHAHAWAEITNKPTEFPPTTHGHAISDVANLEPTLTGLQSDIDTRALASQVVSSIAASLGVEASGSTGAVALTLTSGAQASLAKAETAVQSVSGGTGITVTGTTSASVALTSTAQASLALADTALQPNANATVAGLTVTGDFVHSGEGGIVTESLEVLGNTTMGGALTMTGNATLNGTANTAPSQVFGANNLLTGAVGDARYSWLPAIEVNAAFAPYYGSTPQTIANTLSSTANTVSYADGANGVPLTFMLPWQQWAGKTIKCGAVIAVNGTSGGNLALRFRVQYFTAAQLADESQEFWLSVGGAGTDATGSSSSPQIIAAPTAANRVKLVETGDITIPATARQIAFSFDPLRTNAGDTNTDLLYVHTLRAEVI
jgi:hypothetical protein